MRRPSIQSTAIVVDIVSNTVLYSRRNYEDRDGWNNDEGKETLGSGEVDGAATGRGRKGGDGTWNKVIDREKE